MGAGAAAAASDDFDFSKLNIGHRLGGGSEGQVHFGTYKDQPVAVKIIKVPDDIKVEERADAAVRFANMFDTEVRILSAIQHQNVSKFVAACTTSRVLVAKSPVYYLVTEYLSQGSLLSFLNNRHHKHLPLENILAAALDIARGMELLHAQDIVHRDLKPENILVGKDDHMKIADFGCACSEEYCRTDKRPVGTHLYRAPEMIRMESYGKKVDVYSFGIVLWELFTLTDPFRGMTVDQVDIAVGSKNQRPTIPWRCPSAIKALIEQCWASDPNMRPEFSQVVKVLEKFERSLGRHRTLKSVVAHNPFFSSRDDHHNKAGLLHWLHKIAGPCTHLSEDHHQRSLGCLA